MALSNFDRRRINGPEESFAPVFLDDEGQGFRPEAPRVGRGPKDIRPICASTFDFCVPVPDERDSSAAWAYKPGKWVGIY